MEPKSIKDKIIQTIEVVFIIYYVFMVVDEATDGKASIELKARTNKIKKKVKTVYDNRQQYRKYVGAVLFDAITIVDNTDGTTENNGTN